MFTRLLVALSVVVAQRHPLGREVDERLARRPRGREDMPSFEEFMERCKNGGSDDGHRDRFDHRFILGLSSV